MGMKRKSETELVQEGIQIERARVAAIIAVGESSQWAGFRRGWTKVRDRVVKKLIADALIISMRTRRFSMRFESMRTAKTIAPPRPRLRAIRGTHRRILSPTCPVSPVDDSGPL